MNKQSIIGINGRAGLSRKVLAISLVMGQWISAQATTLTWTNTSGGGWSVTSNWFPNQVPGAADTALITTAGSYTVNLAASSQVSNLVVGAGSGSQNLAVNSVTLTVQSAAVNAGGILNLNSSILAGALTVNGTLNLNSGAIAANSSATIQTNAMLSVVGNAYLYGSLTNWGTATWSGNGSIYLYNAVASGYAGIIVNQPGALFNIQNDQSMLGQQGNPSFINAGTFQKSAGTNTTIGVAFTNTSVINVAIGTVSFTGGATDNGTITGPGNLAVTGGTMIIAGVAPNLIISGGTVKGASATITNLTVNSGSLQGANTVAGLANCTNLTLNGSSSLTVSAGASLNFSGNGSASLYGSLTNWGTIKWSGNGSIYLYNSVASGYAGIIVNQPGALFNIQNDQSLLGQQGNPSFINAGTFQKLAGTNTTIGVAFTNNSVINVAIGTVSFNGGAIDNGTITGPGNLAVTGGTMIIAGVAPNLIISGGTVNGASATITNLTVNSGSLQGANTVAGLANCTNLTLNGSSSLTVSAGASLNFSGNGSASLYGSLTNWGTITWSGNGSIYLYNSVALGYAGIIINQPGALFNIQNDQSLLGQQGNPSFINAGTFQKLAGTNTTIGVAFTNNSVINVAIGTVSFNGGGNDSGTITGPGNLAVTSGTMTIAGVAPNLIISGGTVNGASATITNLTVNSGSLQGANTVAGLANCTNLTLNGSSSLTVSAGASLNFSGGNSFLYGSLTNWGAITWSGNGSIYLYNSVASGYAGIIVNQPGALFNIQNDQSLLGQQGNPSFINAGTFQKLAGTNTTIGVAFTNNSVINVAIGTVSFNGGGNDSGTITGPGNLAVTSGTMTIAGVAPNLIISGGTVNGASAIITNLTVNSGSLQGANTLAVLANCTNLTLNGSSSLTVSAGASLNFRGGNTALYGSLTNWGAITWSGNGSIYLYNSVASGYAGIIVNQPGALFNVQNDQSLLASQGNPSFINAGTFQKLAGTNTTIGVAFTNLGNLNLIIYSHTSFSQINLSSSIALGGALNLIYTNGYSPATGDSFPLLTYGSRSGVFSQVNFSGQAGWQTNLITYGSTVFSATIGSIFNLALTSGALGVTNAGATFAPVIVQVQNLNGVPVATNAVPISIAMTSGSGILAGTLVQNTDPSGKAAFTNLSINLVGPKTLVASTYWAGSATNSVTISAAAAAQLHLVKPLAAFQKQGYPLTPPPTLQVLDQFGNLISNSTVVVTGNSVSSGGGNLGGVTSVAANGVNGSATFSNLFYSLKNPGAAASVTVYFSSPGLTAATNSAVMVDFVCGLLILSNGNSRVEIDPNSQDGVESWVVDGTEQLYQHWFWLREDPGTNQTSFDQLGAPLGASVTASNATFNYFPNGLNVTLSFTLQGGAAGSYASSLLESISVQNATNTSLGLHLYDYTDFDLAGTNEGDTLSIPTNTLAVQTGKSVTATQALSQKYSEWESGWYAFALDTILTENSAVLPDQQILSSTAGDQTFAFQWDTNLTASQTFVLSITNQIQGPALQPEALKITLSGPSTIVSWPTNGGANFQLQSNGSLSPGSAWTNVTNSPSVVGVQFQVIVPRSVGAQFYRLRQ